MKKDNVGFRLMCTWICGYGFGMVTSAGVLDSDPISTGIVILFGFFVGMTAFFVDFSFRVGGLRDRMVDKIMYKKYGSKYDEYKKGNNNEY